MWGRGKTVSEQALAERLKRVNAMYELGRISPEEYTAKCREIDEQRSRMTARPAPLLTQQQQVLTTLVDEWDGMTAEERKQMLAAIFESVTADAEGVDRLEPCEDWRPYVVAAIPRPVNVLRAPTERKTGQPPALGTQTRVRARDGGMDLLRRAA